MSSTTKKETRKNRVRSAYPKRVAAAMGRWPTPALGRKRPRRGNRAGQRAAGPFAWNDRPGNTRAPSCLVVIAVVYSNRLHPMTTSPSSAAKSNLSLDHASPSIGRAVEASPPPAASGIGAVLEQERDLLAATDSFLNGQNGPLSAALHSALREQRSQLGGKIELLKQRYQMPPSAIAADSAQGPTESVRAEIAPENMGALSVLIAQHRTVLGAIASLIIQGFDGRRGKLILTEVASSHEAMATDLNHLLAENPSLADSAAPVVPPTRAEARWENEGGASDPAVVVPVPDAPKGDGAR